MDQGQASSPAEQDAKKLLRFQLKEKLKILTSESMQQQSRQIAQHVLQSRFFHDASSVGLYVTCERLREVDTAALLGEALQHGKQVFVPLVEDKSSNMSLLHIHTLQDLQPAPPFGILEPSRNHPDSSPRMEVLEAPYQLDLLLMPGLGFDRTGGRLGRGGGYYDKLVHNLDDRAQQQQWHRPWLVALAFEEQLSGEPLPMDPHDRHVDVLATPGGLLLCSERAQAHMRQQQQ